MMVREKHDRVRLESGEVLLRPFCVEDAGDIANMGGFPRWDLDGPTPFTCRDAEEYLASEILKPWDNEPSFAIVLGGKVIGIIRLIVDLENSTAEFGYSIAHPHWGKGIIVDVARQFLSWAFSEYNLVKVYAIADIRNKRSVRVMEKLGMIREAVLRKDRFIRGVWTSMVWYGILSEEWDNISNQTSI